MTAPTPYVFNLNAVAEAIGGIIIAGSPWWIGLVFGAALILKMVALVGGAVIGIYGAKRALYPRRNRRRTDNKRSDL